MSDLKQDLDHILGWIVAPENQNDVVKIRARLGRAVVVEADIVAPDANYWSGYRDALDRIIAIRAEADKVEPKTDASLLADLRRVLGEEWQVDEPSPKGFVEVYCDKANYFLAYPNLPSLRTHGPAKIAAALKLLAGAK